MSLSNVELVLLLDVFVTAFIGLLLVWTRHSYRTKYSGVPEVQDD